MASSSTVKQRPLVTAAESWEIGHQTFSEICSGLFLKFLTALVP